MTTINALEVDVEQWVRLWLEAHTGTTALTETPNPMVTPLFQVVRIGGGDDAVILDQATISLHAYAANRPTAKSLAYQARTALYAARGVVFHGAVCTSIRTIGGPSWTPWDDTNVRRVTGTYQVSVKIAP